MKSLFPLRLISTLMFSVALMVFVSLASDTSYAQKRKRRPSPVKTSIPPEPAKPAEPDPVLMNQLTTYLEQLQKNPDDQALREKVIELVQKIKPEPPIPEEARRHFITASSMLEASSTPAVAELAAKEYQQALLLAPWWGDAYSKLSQVWQLLRRYPEAIQALKYYVLTNPDNKRAAQDKIYELQGEQTAFEQEQEAAAKKAQELAAGRARQEAAAREARERAAERERQDARTREQERAREEEARRQLEEQRKWAALDGGVWESTSMYIHDYRGRGAEYTRDDNTQIKILGREMQFDRWYSRPVAFDSREFYVQRDACGYPKGCETRVKISEDGQTIIVEDFALPQPSSYMYTRWEYHRIR